MNYFVKHLIQNSDGTFNTSILVLVKLNEPLEAVGIMCAAAVFVVVVARAFEDGTYKQGKAYYWRRSCRLDSGCRLKKPRIPTSFAILWSALSSRCSGRAWPAIAFSKAGAALCSGWAVSRKNRTASDPHARSIGCGWKFRSRFGRSDPAQSEFPACPQHRLWLHPSVL